MDVSTERAIEIIEEKREVERNKVIQTLGENGEIQVLNGRFGPYFTFEKVNYKIFPKGTDPATLTLERCQELIAAQPEAANKKKPFGRKATAAKTEKKAKAEPKAKSKAKPKAKAPTKK